MWRVTWVDRELPSGFKSPVSVMGLEPRAARRGWHSEDFDSPEEAEQFVRELIDEDPKRHPEVNPINEPGLPESDQP